MIDMSKKLFIIAGAAVVIGLIVFWPSEREITNYPPKNDTIVAFGDSLVAGRGDDSGGGFVTDLEDELDVSIQNKGVDGDTTEDGLARLNSVIDQDPGIVILLLGGNDYLRDVPIETTRRNLSRIITRLHESGAVVILLGVRGGILRDNYADMYANLADTHGTAYIPNVLDGLIGDPELMHDKIHPNAEGYERIAERVGKKLERVIQKRL